MLEQVAALERQLRSGLEPVIKLHSVGDVRVIGGVGAVELVRDKKSKASAGYLDEVGPRLYLQFMERGLLLRPLGSILYFMPPYCITEQETRWALEQIAEVLSDLPRPAGEVN